jgi:hypothetical protein
MNVLYTASNVAELKVITQFVHDCAFNIDDIVHDTQSATVKIPFRRVLDRPTTVRSILGRLGLVDYPEAEYILTVGKVKSFVAHDTQGVGRFEFESLKYDPDEHRLHVATDIPSRIVAGVEELMLGVDKTGNVFSGSKRLRLLPKSESYNPKLWMHCRLKGVTYPPV